MIKTGTSRDGHFAQIIVKFWTKWPTLPGPGHFSRNFIPMSKISKGYLIWIKFGAAQTCWFLRFEATGQLQIEGAGKILGWSVTFGPKSVENRSELDNFFELTTPSNQPSFFFGCRKGQRFLSETIKVAFYQQFFGTNVTIRIYRSMSNFVYFLATNSS